MGDDIGTAAAKPAKRAVPANGAKKTMIEIYIIDGG